MLNDAPVGCCRGRPCEAGQAGEGGAAGEPGRRLLFTPPGRGGAPIAAPANR